MRRGQLSGVYAKSWNSKVVVEQSVGRHFPDTFSLLFCIPGHSPLCMTWPSFPRLTSSTACMRCTADVEETDKLQTLLATCCSGWRRRRQRRRLCSAHHAASSISDIWLIFFCHHDLLTSMVNFNSYVTLRNRHRCVHRSRVLGQFLVAYVVCVAYHMFGGQILNPYSGI